MPTKFFYFFIFFLLFISCSTKKSGQITYDNLEDKIQDAFLEAELHDDVKTLIPVLFFIDKNNIVFKDTCVLSKVYHLKAIKFRTINNNKDFLKYAMKSVNVAKNCNDYIINVASNNLLGIFYHENDDYLRSIDHYKKAISYGKKSVDNSFIIDTYVNLTKIYTLENNWKEVIANANKGIVLAKDSEAKKDRIKYFYIFLAKAYTSLFQFDLAESYLVEAIKNTENSKEPIIEQETIKFYREIYLIYAELNKKQNNFELAYNYMKDSDSLSVLANQVNKDRVRSYLSIEDNLEKKLLISKQKIISNHRIILIGCIFFLLISFCLIYRSNYFSKKLKVVVNEKEELNHIILNNFYELKETHKGLILKNKEIEKLLKYNEQALLTKTLKISNYKDAINNVIKKINFLIEDKKGISGNKMHSVNRSLQLIISEEGIWEDFKIQFEKNRPYFFKKLLKIAPDLSIVNQKHCAYVAINLRSKEVANILNLSTRSVETTRYRIKKKLKIEKETLQEFLARL
ncbi:hypothetical protein [Polaribacter sp. Asnod1-A03]|uniref:tetratricopeptide repeat protein n=1 Tax=Polaribacter sp. Asnod1-A03 TaxID=3160581 RepID=UPI00386F78FB